MSNADTPFYQILARAAHSWSRLAVFVAKQHGTVWNDRRTETQRYRALAKQTLIEAREAKERHLQRMAA